MEGSRPSSKCHGWDDHHGRDDHSGWNDRPPALVFSPLAWLKLQFFCNAGETEVGGFGVCRPGEPLYVDDFVTVVQRVSCVTVEFDDAAVADYFDDRVDRGLVPSQFARIWLHTHPGCSAKPSITDERTFERVFGRCDWSVMFILARSGQTYARLKFAAGPGAAILLPVEMDWAAWPQAVIDHGARAEAVLEAWMDEYGQNVRPEDEPTLFGATPGQSGYEVSRSSGPVSRLTVPADRELLPAWDGEWWELDPELAALAQMEAELEDERRVLA
jgi:hypothetical protein